MRLVKNNNSVSKSDLSKGQAQQMNASRFLRDVEDIVQAELQKSSFCLDGINQDITSHQKELRFQLTTLKELWRLVPPSKDREARAIKKMDRIAASRQAIADCQERILVIQQRVAVLQEQLYA